MTSRAVNTALFLGYAGVVGILSLSSSAGVAADNWDKLAHFLCYALFAILAYRVNPRSPVFPALCVGIIAFGGLLEYGQSLTPDRTMSLADFVANTAGVIAGGLLARMRARN